MNKLIKTKKIANTTKIPTIIIYTVIVFFAITGCRTVENCVENQVMGNMGSVINSRLDEHSPSILVLPNEAKIKFPTTDTNDYLIFTATSYELGTNEAIYNLLLNDMTAGAELITDKNFPLNDTSRFRNAGVPVFRYNPKTEKLDLFFAALPKFGRLSRDIYFAEKDLTTNEWTAPTQLSINTARWESHPTISPDGTMLAFSSDRPDGEGDIDIWVSYLNDDGSWSEAANLGEAINTSGIDYMPMFTENNDLIFSSNGHSRHRKDFDIFHAKFDSTTRMWTEPTMFSFPINTEFDEAGGAIWKNRIYLSSNRRGGCGGKDIYSFQLCGPIMIAGRVKCADQSQILEGKMFLYDENHNVVGYSDVAADGSFRVEAAEPNTAYIIDYQNKCYPRKRNVYDFRTPCSDSSVIMVVVDMVMPEKSAEFELTEIEIPFFVTGYYRPNTESNLNALRLGFSYNLYGTNHRTRYIENPKENYDQFVHQVEASLDDVAKYIANMLSVLDNQCLTVGNKGKLHISVLGWADQRGISAGSEYSDENIDDPTFNLQVKKGAKMTNDLLSKLRAYFTAKYFESKLLDEYSREELSNLITWEIRGKGIDVTEIEDELKRRVTITLQFLE